MRLCIPPLLLVILLSGIPRTTADAEETSDRLDDFGDLSLDGNDQSSSADLSHLSDDEFLAGVDGGVPVGGVAARPGEVPASSAAADKASLMLRVVGAALKRPGMTTRFGQILPILRVMSPPQRLALAALVMQQAMVPADVAEPPLEMAVKMGATPDGRSNLTTQLLLPLSADIAHMFRGAGLEGKASGAEGAEGAEGLAAQGRSAGSAHGPGNFPFRQQGPPQAPRWRGPPTSSLPAAVMPPALHGPPRRYGGDLDRLSPPTPPTAGLPPPGVNRRNAHIPPSREMEPPPLPGRSATTLRPLAPPATSDRGDQHGCSLFSDTVCASVEHYPEEAILASIQADRHTVDALLADKFPATVARAGHGPPEMQRRQDDDFPSGHEIQQDAGGQDGVEDTLLCPSIVKYARPQRARATSGQWKFIVNTAEHTQTLRLEKCSRVEEPCHYLSDKVRSHCSQVYNYHRLLTWDKEQGLHMDIFKVPTCCSCQVLKSPFLTSNSVARRPGQQYQQPVAEYSENRETVVSPQYTLKPFNQGEPKPATKAATKPVWPFRRAATRRPPTQGAVGQQYGLQSLDENAAPGELLPQYPPLPLQNEYEYPPLAGRRTATVRNRTRINVPDDLTAEGSQRRPIPVILSPEGAMVRPSTRPPTSKTPFTLPPRLETYRPRPSTGASSTSAATTALPIITMPATTAAPAASYNTASPKRVNYSYHPIIDFFRPLEKHMAAQEPRSARPHDDVTAVEKRTAPDSPEPTWSVQQSDWSPITREDA